MTKLATKEQTPIFDALIAQNGNPIVRPVLDRSFTKLSQLAEAARTSTKKAPKATLPASKTSKNSDQDSERPTDQVAKIADSRPVRQAPASSA